MKSPHIMLIPYPAQGHVIPLMELALRLVNYGCKVTFVNTQFIHERVIKALPETENLQEIIQMVSIPDGLESSDDRSDQGKLAESIFAVMPDELMALIEQINGSESDKITCLIADATMGWALEVAEKMGIKNVAFWPAAATQLALVFKIPNLIDDRIIDSDGEYSLNIEQHLSVITETDGSVNVFFEHLRIKDGQFSFYFHSVF